MLSRGQLQAPDKPSLKYVYVKMITAQADTQEGKLRRGDVLMVTEDKAMRWVYRSRIALPATADEYNLFRERFVRTRNGTARLPGRGPRGMEIPEDPGFSYVDDDSPESQEANRGHADSRLQRAAVREEEESLGAKLAALNAENRQTTLDEEEEDDGLDLPPDPQSADQNSVPSQAPVFDARIGQGPAITETQARARSVRADQGPRVKARARPAHSNAGDSKDDKK